MRLSQLRSEDRGRSGPRWERISPGVIAFGSLLAAAAAVRVYALASYTPAVLTHQAHDAAAYVRAASVRLSQGAQDPLGYPIFLRVVHALSHALTFTIAAQHAMGIAAGLLLYCAVRRLKAPRAVALVPAAVLWLNGDELFLEHALLSETLFTLLLAGALYAAVRAVQEGTRWACLAGALAGSLLAVRTVGMPLPLLLVAWLLLARWRLGLPWRRPVAAALGAVVIVVTAYGVVQHHATGRGSIFVEGSGWILYGRAAQFADCRRFIPPQGTRALCDRTPRDHRQGPMYYIYTGGPAHRTFGEPASHDHLLREFALTAIENQPGDFLRLAGTDIVRYVDPTFGRLGLGDYSGPSALQFPAGPPVLDPETVRQVSAYYGRVLVPRGAPARGLEQYQRVVRINGVIALILLLVGVAGTLAATGPLRWVLVLLVATSLALTVLPALTHSEWRFVLPAMGPIAAGGAIGAWSLARRLRTARPVTAHREADAL